MPELTFKQMFGSRSKYEHIDEVGGEHNLYIDIRDFKNKEDGGDIENGLGISELSREYVNFYAGLMGIQTFYALMLLIMQNQAGSKDDDIEQKIYIAESGVSVINFGNRKGQLERRFTVSIFSDGSYGNTADIDNV